MARTGVVRTYPRLTPTRAVVQKVTAVKIVEIINHVNVINLNHWKGPFQN